MKIILKAGAAASGVAIALFWVAPAMAQDYRDIYGNPPPQEGSGYRKPREGQPQPQYYPQAQPQPQYYPPQQPYYPPQPQYYPQQAQPQQPYYSPRRSRYEQGEYCATPYGTCDLPGPMFVGKGCKCTVPGVGRVNGEAQR